MPANTVPIYPATPYAVSASLAAVAACTTRAPTATAALAAANIISFVPVSTNGLRIDSIQIRAASTSITAPTVAQTVLLWMWNGTTAYVIDELIVSAVTPSTSTPSFTLSKSYSNLVLPAGFALYVSTTIATTAATTALVVHAFGGAY